MPWCGTCERWWAPNAATPDGRCPDCGRALDRRVTAGARRPPPAGGDRSAEGLGEEPGDDIGFPWHLKLLVAAVAAYLVWRIVQMVGWAFG
jgi:hypothetical protein